MAGQFTKWKKERSYEPRKTSVLHQAGVTSLYVVKKANKAYECEKHPGAITSEKFHHEHLPK